MPTRALLAIVVAVALLPVASHGSATPAQKCAVAKNKATAKKILAKLKCWQKAIGKGLPAADSLCLSSAEAKFHTAVTKAESSNACVVMGDESTLEDAVDACVESIVSLTPATTTTTTTSTTTTTTACAYTPFTPVAQDMIDALRLDASGDMNVPASCGGSPTFCCTGGTPISSCGPLQFDFVAQAGDLPAAELHSTGDPNVFTATLRPRLKTVNDIPVNIPVIGDCGLRIDTTPGPSQQIQIDYSVTFSADRIQMGPVGTISISNLTSDDLSLTGGVSCSFANLGLSFYLSVLTDTLAQDLSFGTLCRCGSDLFSCGP